MLRISNFLREAENLDLGPGDLPIGKLTNFYFQTLYREINLQAGCGVRLPICNPGLRGHLVHLLYFIDGYKTGEIDFTQLVGGKKKTKFQVL